MQIALLISGGVDSSVALALLKEQKFSVTAFYLKVWLEDELDHISHCPWEEDLRYVEETCQLLETPLVVLAMQQEYRQSVIRYTLDSVSKGHTPNPDIFCNSRIKFGAFLERIGPGFAKVASGHYAAVREKEGHYQLLSSADKIKDQTYFLAHLDQQQLSRVLFPLAEMSKQQVRAYAKRQGLPAQDRKDSQGLCFLGRFPFRQFLAHYLGEKRGDLIEWESGKKLGEHRGFWFYTIGQRQGLGLSGGPWYVVCKDSSQNCLYLSRNYNNYSHSDGDSDSNGNSDSDNDSDSDGNSDSDNDSNSNSDSNRDIKKGRNSFYIENPHWISGKAPQSLRLEVKLRHGEQTYSCQLKRVDKKRFFVTIAGEDQGIASGQFAVFYSDKLCLGCGMMENPTLEKLKSNLQRP